MSFCLYTLSKPFQVQEFSGPVAERLTCIKHAVAACTGRCDRRVVLTTRTHDRKGEKSHQATSVAIIALVGYDTGTFSFKRGDVGELLDGEGTAKFAKLVVATG